MFFQRWKTPGLGQNSYVLACGDGLAVVIDPRRDVDDYLHLARENDLSIAYVQETHRQEDFEFGSRTLAKMTADKCWGVFTGDTLFVGDTGRTDLPDPEKTGENAGILYDSVHGKIAPLGDHTLLFPAHGAGSACGGNISERDDSTLGIEKGTNPVFSKSRRDFVSHKLAVKMARPHYFLHMEEVNLLPGRPIKWPSTFQVLQPREFQHRMKEGLVIDTRSPEVFAAAHIPGAYNIWLDGVPAFGGWVANENTRIFLVADGSEAMELAVMPLARIGIDSVEGILANGMEGWRDEGLPIESIATTSAQETAIWM